MKDKRPNMLFMGDIRRAVVIVCDTKQKGRTRCPGESR